MSVIQEALKKAQENYSLENKIYTRRQNVCIAKPDTFKNSKGRSKKNNPFLIPLLIILFMAVGVTILSYFDSSQSSKIKPNIPNIQSLKPLEEKAVKNPTATPARKVTPALVLNGIMHLQERPQAIINMAVVEEGDVIDGAMVTKIDENSVKLISNNSEIILKLK